MSPAQNPPTKAKSRLVAASEPSFKKGSSRLAKTTAESIVTSELPSTAHTSKSAPAFIQKRLRFLPLLGLGISGFATCLYIFTTVAPEQIADVLFFHSYLPLLLIIFAAVFFTSNFFFLHSRRAAEISFFCTILLFLQLQDVLVTLQLVGVIGVGLLAAEALLTFIFKR